MGRVARALIVHELMERGRDRWVIVTTLLFALLATGIGAYGHSSADAASVITAPSLVTLNAFLVPLVALILGHDAIVGERERHTLGLLMSLPVARWEVLVAKFIGRVLALSVAVSVGFAAAAVWLDATQRPVILSLLAPSLLLGAAFLSFGVLLSVASRKVATAASLAVVTWFLLILFYDLALLSAMVATDGALSQDAVAWLVTLNPAGLYRTSLMTELMGADALAELGLVISLPGRELRALVWAAWIVGPLVAGAALLSRRSAVAS
ncbi:MAG: ABC transporter permease subunit [Proteobacteria bacterium]|nr:ABC transporter permease subunit [Pseudomonadota bacterium]MCP4919816.1 ABC transporter permease subunit [Pseudomonadota bacterium]